MEHDHRHPHHHNHNIILFPIIVGLTRTVVLVPLWSKEFLFGGYFSVSGVLAHYGASGYFGQLI